MQQLTGTVNIKVALVPVIQRSEPQSPGGMQRATELRGLAITA